MASRRKTSKKSQGHATRTQKRSGKAASKSRAKAPSKLEAAARAARKKAARAKAVAKNASRAAVRSKAKIAATRGTSAKSAERASVKSKETTAKVEKAAPANAASPMVHSAKESELTSGAKAKTSAKAVTERTETAAAAKPPAANPARAAENASGAQAHARAAAPSAATPAPPPRPTPIEKAPAPPAASAAAAIAAKPAATAPRHGFKGNEFVVYPAHGVGQIVAIEEQEVAGFRLELFVITFVKDKMMLRVPVGKATSVGMRRLSDPDLVKRALDTLLGRARIKRTMWSRRAQEYEAKINSGDLIAIAEVVRDLYRSEAQPEQSYSERQLYEAALDRMAREVAVVQKLSEAEALKVIEGQLQKGQRRGKSDAAAGETGETDVEEAA
jgi:CarD family transcriptional regulator, regulator of rRNA transcription